MLSLFPELLFLAPFAAFVIRVTVGIMLGLAAYRHVIVSNTPIRILGVFEGVVAVLLIAGAYTQAAALIGAFLIALTLWIPRYRTFPRSTLSLLLIMILNLVILGAGPFAFDLPL